MDTQTLWLLALSVATPLAGVVGFAIQLRQVKKTRLENEKLHLEIEALKRRSVEHDRRVQVATLDEVERFAGREDIRFSRGGPSATLESASLRRWEKTVQFLLALLAVTFTAYLAYDLYRLVRWLWSLM